MLICVCFAGNIRANYAFLLFCTKSVKLLGHQRQSTKSRETESTSRRSVDVLFLPHSGGECVHSAFLILQCNRASPCLENRRGIEAPSIRPPSLSGLSGHFTCGSGPGRKVFILATSLCLKLVYDFLITASVL